MKTWPAQKATRHPGGGEYAAAHSFQHQDKLQPINPGNSATDLAPENIQQQPKKTR